MELIANFAVETFAGLVGVFAGVLLALWMDRRRSRRRAEESKAALADELKQSRDLVLSSVVKNASEAKEVRGLVRGGKDPYLFQLGFELAVWEATREQFVQIASLDERVLLTRFFDQVRRLDHLIDFHRSVLAQVELRQSPADAGDRALMRDLADRLCAVADEVRLDGVVVVTDLGGPMHKRLLGIRAEEDGGNGGEPPARSDATPGR